MIQEKITLTRPHSNIPWHWLVVDRTQYAAHLVQQYIFTDKLLKQYEETPDVLTSVWFRIWDSMASFEEFSVDPEVLIYKKVCKDYNDSVGIITSEIELTGIE